MKPFLNPYINGDPAINLSKDDTYSRRVTFSVHDDDKVLLHLVRPRHGTETTAMTILYRKLCQSCRARGIIDLTHAEAFEHFVANLELTLPSNEQHQSTESKPKRTRRTSPKPSGETTPPTE